MGKTSMKTYMPASFFQSATESEGMAKSRTAKAWKRSHRRAEGGDKISDAFSPPSF